MKKLFIMIVIILLVNIKGYSAFEARESGARPAALGGAYVAGADDIYAPEYNPAGLGGVKDFSAVINYYPLLTSLESEDSISFMNFSVAYPIRSLYYVFGFSFDTFGFDLYKETTFRFTHSLVLGRVLRFGYNIKYMKLNISDYGNAGTFGIDVGAIGRVSRNLKIGAMGYNINAPKLGDSGVIELSQAGSIGVFYHPTRGLDISAELYKVVDLPLQIRAGSEFRFSKYVYLRGGAQSNPTKFSIGLGINWSMFHLDYAFVTHNELGNEHIFSFVFELTPKRVDIYGAKVRPRKSAQPEIIYTGPKININTASLDELTEIPRVGPKSAQRIIDYRKKHGPFKSIEDIKKVKGFGPKTFAKIKYMITVGGEEKGKEGAEVKQGIDVNDLQMKDMVGAGIKPITALRILQYIKKQGGISSLEELKKVDGVDDKVIEKLKKITGEK